MFSAAARSRTVGRAPLTVHGACLQSNRAASYAIAVPRMAYKALPVEVRAEPICSRYLHHCYSAPIAASAF